MILLVGLVRIPAFLALVLLYMAVSVAGELFLRDSRARCAFLSRMTSFSSRIGLRIFNIRFTVREKDPCVKGGGGRLIVANHVSYLDILILSAMHRSLYITSVEVQKTFFLGMMTRFAGSLFVERRSKSRLIEEIGRVTCMLREGFTVTLFPEGTTSNGEKILPFKGSLFMAAEEAGADVQPVCMRYTEIDGKEVSPANRDLAFYYGGIRFFPHLMRLFFVKSIRGTVTFLEPIAAAGRARKELAHESFQAIDGCFKAQARCDAENSRRP